MTLEEFKIKVLSMIEEYNENAENLTDDDDIATKLNSVINQVQNEIARFKKIDAYKEMEVSEGDVINLTDIDMNIYRSMYNVNLDTLIGYKQNGIRHFYLENYNEEN